MCSPLKRSNTRPRASRYRYVIGCRGAYLGGRSHLANRGRKSSCLILPAKVDLCNAKYARLSNHARQLVPCRRHAENAVFHVPYIGVGHPSQKHTGRGGARNSRLRVTSEIGVRQAGMLIQAAQRSVGLGLPLNRFITIHWEALGVSAEGLVAANGKFLNQYRRYMANRGYQGAYLYVHENAAGKGRHTHILAYVPYELIPELTHFQLEWLQSISGNPYKAKAIKSEPVGPHKTTYERAYELYTVNLYEAVDYVLKGASKEARAIYGIWRDRRQGTIMGKRCGCSVNLTK